MIVAHDEQNVPRTRGRGFFSTLLQTAGNTGHQEAHQSHKDPTLPNVRLLYTHNFDPALLFGKVAYGLKLLTMLSHPQPITAFPIPTT